MAKIKYLFLFQGLFELVVCISAIFVLGFQLVLAANAFGFAVLAFSAFNYSDFRLHKSGAMVFTIFNFLASSAQLVNSFRIENGVFLFGAVAVHFILGVAFLITYLKLKKENYKLN